MSPQVRGILKEGEDVEVKENAACSLFPERDPLSPMRRFFGSSKGLHLRSLGEANGRFHFRWWKEMNIINPPINQNLKARLQ